MRFLLVIPVLLLGLIPSPSVSGDLYGCKVPEPYDLPTDALGFCDIYQRQLAYREEAIKLDKQLRERQENYAAPRRQAYKQYLKDLKNVDKTRGTPMNAPASEDDVFFEGLEDKASE